METDTHGGASPHADVIEAVMALLKRGAQPLDAAELRQQAIDVAEAAYTTARVELSNSDGAATDLGVRALVSQALRDEKYDPDIGPLLPYLSAVLERLSRPGHIRTTPTALEMWDAKRELEQVSSVPDYPMIAERINLTRLTRLEEELTQMLALAETDPAYRSLERWSEVGYSATGVRKTTAKEAIVWVESAGRSSIAKKARELLESLPASDGGRVRAEDVERAEAQLAPHKALQDEPVDHDRQLDVENACDLKRWLEGLSPRQQRAVVMFFEGESWLSNAIGDLVMEHRRQIGWDGEPLGKCEENDYGT